MRPQYPMPAATYRLQFHGGFGFADALRIVPYLDSLGVSHIYASPIYRARAGSLHGYDVTAWDSLNPELGSEEEFGALAAALRVRGMGLLLDIVPNHMAADSANPWWWRALEMGPLTPFGTFFDFRWERKAAPDRYAKLLVPVLGGRYGDVLERGELKLGWARGGLVVDYYENRFPISPRSYRLVLGYRFEALRSRKAELAQAVDSLHAILERCEAFPDPLTKPAPADADWIAEAEALKSAIFELCSEHQAIGEFLYENIRWFNGTPGESASFALLDELLSEQAYRLAHWRLAATGINYRRFFDINALVGLRMAEPAVFAAVHEDMIGRIAAGAIQGLRIDHIDGLWDPAAYLEALQRAIAKRLGRPAPRDFYVIVEKIFGSREALPHEWRAAGSTGYDFLRMVAGLFIEPRGLQYLDANYARFTGDGSTFVDAVRDAKLYVVYELFPGELEALTDELVALAEADLYARDVPRRALQEALLQTTACLSVYRTYIRDGRVSPADRESVAAALACARARTELVRVGDAAFEFLRTVLMQENLPRDESERQRRLTFIMRWQQFTGPVMAKGMEDTAFFRHTRLISLTDVGVAPEDVDHPADVAAFHRYNIAQQSRWPGALNATSTHDTKRSADVNARIHVLSELPFTWARAVRRWHKMNLRFHQPVAVANASTRATAAPGESAPDRNEELLAYQTLIGGWPIDPANEAGFGERLTGFMRKAAREAKVNTNWLHPDEAYENALLAFVDGILADGGPFLKDFRQFHSRIAAYGAWNSLSQVVLKATSPGVPDIYQGDELWDFSLTDPDNRRPVDFKLREELLADLAADEDRAALVDGLMAAWRDGRIKLFVTTVVLHHRRKHAALYEAGDYVPVPLAGALASNVCAYLRRHAGEWTLTAVPRLLTGIVPPDRPPLGPRAWKKTFLRMPVDAPKRWRSVFTGELIEPAATVLKGGVLLPVEQVFGRLPVGLFVGQTG